MLSRQLNRSICTSSRNFVFKRLTSSKVNFKNKKKGGAVQTIIEFKKYINPTHLDSMLIIGTTAWCVVPIGTDGAVDCFLRGCVALLLSAMLVEFGLTSVGLFCIPTYMISKSWKNFKKTREDELLNQSTP